MLTKTKFNPPDCSRIQLALQGPTELNPDPHMKVALNLTLCDNDYSFAVILGYRDNELERKDHILPFDTRLFGSNEYTLMNFLT